jgi:hypothetical protein
MPERYWRHVVKAMDDLVMEMAYELEAEGVYGAAEEALCAEDIAPVLEALKLREISLEGFWGQVSEEL